MHAFDDEARELTQQVVDYAVRRLAMDPPTLDGPRPQAELEALVPQTITEEGIGGEAALRLFEDVLAPACITIDHPAYLSFIPAAPTQAASAFDLVVSASSIYGGSWLEGAGAVYAENQVLHWLAREAGLPEGAGGTFAQGGTVGNLSALVTARFVARHYRTEAGRPIPDRWAVVCSAEAHSSITAAAAVMDVDVIRVPVGESGKLTGEAIEAAVSDWDSVFAIVATGGTTNFGIVDDLASIADVAQGHDVWLHVDGAYGLAGMLSPEHRHLYEGIERVDSFIVDPHKWLFAPFDACALVYRQPQQARAAHTQHAEYLDLIYDSPEWNPSDYAVNLTRRARGLPLWFSLATHGVSAYRDAIAHGIETAHAFADVVRTRDFVSLVREPELSVVVLERHGWNAADYDLWAREHLEAGRAFLFPSSHQGRPVMRFAVVNPRSSLELMTELLDSMEKER